MQHHSERIFSAVQASGDLHLGNYLGAIKQWVDLQQNYDCTYCAVDMHALTVNPAPQDLIDSTRNAVAAFLACGIDAKQHIVFNQSRVPQHSELCWIFNCIARVGWLNRMTQFKDKAGKDREKASLGLYVYPSLMAADILLYKATIVPVGTDQKQHIELTRDIAKKFNADYEQRLIDLNYGQAELINGEAKQIYFKLPTALISSNAPRIMSLKDGTKKMSKSDPSPLSRINLKDSADDIALKIRKAKTDTLPIPENIAELELRPEANNLIGIYAAFINEKKEEVLQQFAGQPFSTFKASLTELATEKLGKISYELHKLAKDPGYIDNILHNGAERAQNIAEKNLKEIKEIVGFI